MNRTRARLLRSRQLLAGAGILSAILLAALLAPCLAPHHPLEQQLLLRRQPPSLEHPFGLDELGRDNLSRVLYGTRLSLRIGVGAVLLALAAGGLIGGLAGYYGGWLDSVTMGFVDVIMAFPTLLLAIAIVVVLDRGLAGVTAAVAITAIPTYARLTRVGVLAAKERDHVLAARAVGVPVPRLLRRHILPGCLATLLAQATLGVGTAILEASSLGFLGLGTRPPVPEWGAMLGQGRGSVFAAPHIVLFPGLAITITVLGFHLLGNGLLEAADPRLGRR